jgi:hypothetical protein
MWEENRVKTPGRVQRRVTLAKRCNHRPTGGIHGGDDQGVNAGKACARDDLVAIFVERRIIEMYMAVGEIEHAWKFVLKQRERLTWCEKNVIGTS